MSYEPTYKTVEDAMKAIDLGVEDTLRDNPDLKPQEDTIYHDIAQSVMLDCPEDVARELSRRTGVGSIYGETDEQRDARAEQQYESRYQTKQGPFADND